MAGSIRTRSHRANGAKVVNGPVGLNRNAIAPSQVVRSGENVIVPRWLPVIG
jgi:hypothetical protein